MRSENVIERMKGVVAWWKKRINDSKILYLVDSGVGYAWGVE